MVFLTGRCSAMDAASLGFVAVLRDPGARFGEASDWRGPLRVLTVTLLATFLCAALTGEARTSTDALSHTRGIPKPPAALVKLIRRYFPRDYDRAVCIAWHESRFARRAYYLGNYGLYQLNRSTWDWRHNARAVPVVGRVDWTRIYDPEVNIRAAAAIYRHAHGWGPWSTRGMCGG